MNISDHPWKGRRIGAPRIGSDSQEPHAVAGPTTDSSAARQEAAPPQLRGGGLSCAHDSPSIFIDLWSGCPCSSFFN